MPIGPNIARNDNVVPVSFDNDSQAFKFGSGAASLQNFLGAPTQISAFTTLTGPGNFINAANSDISLILPAGLGSLALNHGATNALSVTAGAGTTSLTGLTTTSPSVPRVVLTEKSPGVYVGEVDRISPSKYISRSTKTGYSANVAKHRWSGHINNDNAQETFFCTVPAPGPFSAVRVSLLSRANSGVNNFTCSVAPSAKLNNGYVAVDSTNTTVAPTQVTFGSTDWRNPRNPGGGSTSAICNNGSGTFGNNNFIESRVSSDWIQLQSLDRVDFPLRDRLLFLRVYGTNQGAFTPAGFNPGGSNYFGNAYPDFACGYWSAASDNTLVSAPVAPTLGNWAPGVEVDFLLQGVSVNSIGFMASSVSSGYHNSSAVPLYGGYMNGWGRKLAVKLDATVPTSFTDLCYPGQVTGMGYQRALSAVMAGGLTHLFYQIWTDNDPSTAAQGQLAVKWASDIINLCQQYSVTPILIKTFSEQNIGSAARNAADAFYARATADGILGIDLNPLACDPVTGQLLPKYQTLNASGAWADGSYPEHPNELLHNDASDYVLRIRSSYGL